jgi:hypothetical protein
MIPPLPTVVTTTMAMRAERMHHYLFHEVRNNWLSYSGAVQQQLTDLGWAPPRPALDANGSPLRTNNSGEDFLYMHRQMITRVNGILAQAGSPDYPQIVGWDPVPAPGDADYPVPPVWDSSLQSLQEVKSDDFYTNRIVVWEQQYTDPNNLARWTLGELGSRLEFSIHNAMHRRWSSQPTRIRPPVDPTEMGATIPTAFDDPSYDFLGDTYSSHVNSIFWKLHGWIDDRIEDWKAANGVIGEPHWVGTWMGKMEMPPMHSMEMLAGVHLGFAAMHAPEHLQNTEQAMRVIARTGVSHPQFLIDPSLVP